VFFGLLTCWQEREPFRVHVDPTKLAVRNVNVTQKSSRVQRTIDFTPYENAEILRIIQVKNLQNSSLAEKAKAIANEKVRFCRRRTWCLIWVHTDDAANREVDPKPDEEYGKGNWRMRRRAESRLRGSLATVTATAITSTKTSRTRTRSPRPAARPAMTKRKKSL
jgi:hypothetical protein